MGGPGSMGMDAGNGIHSGSGLPMSMSPSSSFLSPSNASAAFLPSIHQHHQQFMNKRSISNGLRPLTSTSSSNNNNGSTTPVNGTSSPSANAAQLLARLTGDTGIGLGGGMSPPPTSASFHQAFRPPGLAQSISGTGGSAVTLNDDFSGRSQAQAQSQYPHHLSNNNSHQQYAQVSNNNAQHQQHQHHHHHQQQQQQQHNQQHVAPAMALSPSTRALQAHAPGQSLPQGLAAGYSRIHALPPPPAVGNLPSPSMFGSVTSGGMGGIGSLGQGQGQGGLGLMGIGPGGGLGGQGQQQQQHQQPSLSDWIGMSPGAAAANGHSILGATARGSPLSGSVALPGMGGRQVSGGNGPAGRSWAGVVSGREREGGAAGTLSPLSGPVVSAGHVGGGDDDDLFVLDG